MIRSLLAAVALALASVSTGFAEDAAKPDAVVGTKAPAPKLTALDGKPVAFDALRGKAATVVVFVSFDCPVSNSYVAPLHELARAHADKGVTVVLVCPTDDAPEAVAKAAAGFKLAVPAVLDPKKELAAGLKALATPEAFVLDADGTVRYRGRIDDAYSARLKRNQTVSSHDLADALAAVLAGKPVATAVTKPIGCAIDLEPAAAPKAGAVTFYKDVAPILNANCVVCHRPGEVGPFALTTYNQARRWATDIKDVTGSKHMPPWMPAGDGVALRGARKLSAGEIALLGAWADAGAPEGDPKDAPKAPDFGDGWRHGKPDMILTPGEDFHLAATGGDLFRVFVIPTNLTEGKWVIGYDVKPGNPRVVHHTLHFFDTTGQGRGLEKKQQDKDRAEIPKGTVPDHGPGYTASMGVGFIARGGKKGDEPAFGGIGGWAPGQAPQFLPAGAGWRLPKGSDFLIQTHYHRNSQAATDRTQVGLYFAKSPPEQPWQTIVVDGMKPGEKIPAGVSNHVARALYLHTDAVLHSVLPHMHLLGKSVKVTMTPPGGTPVVLVDIKDWHYNWQETYWFEKPITAKAGTRIEIEAVFDNSTGNPNNPSSPPREVSVGEKTTDEMLFGFLGATSTKTPHEKVRVSAFPTPGVIAFDPPAKGQLTPVLENRLGEWDVAMVAKPRNGSESKITGDETVKKAFDGTYLMVRADDTMEGSGRYELITFDTEKKAYRMWTYTQQGSVFEWDGVWDEKAKTLTWSAPLSSGLTGTLRWAFASDDKVDQELVLKLGPFTAYTSTGALTRKPK